MLIIHGLGFSLLSCGEPRYEIARTMKVGDTWSYTLEETLHIRDESVSLQVELINRVVEVKHDGSAIVEREIEGDPETLKTLQEEMTLFGTLPTRSRLRFTPRGEEEPLDNSATLLVSVPYAYPDKPVKVGERWEHTHTSGSMKAHYQCRFVGIENLNGTPCYKIRATATPIPQSLPQLEGEVTIFIDTKSGWIRQIEGILVMSAGEFRGDLKLKVVGRPVLPKDKTEGKP